MISYKRGRVSDLIYLHSPRKTTDLINFDSPDKVLILPLIRSPIEAGPRPLTGSNRDSLGNNNTFDAVTNKAVQLKDDSFQKYVEEAIGYSALSASLLGTTTCSVQNSYLDHPSDLLSGSENSVSDKTVNIHMDPSKEGICKGASRNIVIGSGVERDYAGACLNYDDGTSPTLASPDCHLLGGSANVDLSILNDSEMNDSLLGHSARDNESLHSFKDPPESDNHSKSMIAGENIDRCSRSLKLEAIRLENFCGYADSSQYIPALLSTQKETSSDEQLKTYKVLSESLQSHHIDDCIASIGAELVGKALPSGENIINSPSAQSSIPSALDLQESHGVFKTKFHTNSTLLPYTLCKLPRPKKKLSPKFQKLSSMKNCTSSNIKS